MHDSLHKDDSLDSAVRAHVENSAKKLDRKLAALVQDVCNECLGTGSLQFCGGETCPACKGTGKPSTELSVHECSNCGLEAIGEDLPVDLNCVYTGNPHKFYLKTIYTKDSK